MCNNIVTLPFLLHDPPAPHNPFYSANCVGMFKQSRLLVHRQHERNAWCNNYKSDVMYYKHIQEHHIYVQALRMWFFENIPTETKLTICIVTCLMTQRQGFSRLLFLSFHCVLNVICSFLGNSPASEF